MESNPGSARDDARAACAVPTEGPASAQGPADGDSSPYTVIMTSRELASLRDPGEETRLRADEQQAILEYQQSILRAVLGSRDSIAMVADICHLAEMLLPNAVGTVMLRNPDDRKLYVYSSPSVPDAAVMRLNGLQPGPGGGSCGNVIYQGTPQFVSNTFSDPRWTDLRQVAYDFNLCACWSVPVHDDAGEIIGTFALSSFEHRAPGWFHRKLLETGAALVGIVLSHAKWQDSLRLYGRAFDSAQEGMLVTDSQLRIVEVNPGMSRMVGYERDELLGRTPSMLASGLHGEDFYAAMWGSLRDTGAWSGEIWNRRRNGEVYPEWLSIKAIHGSDGSVTHYLGVFNDLSQAKAAENAIQHLSTHDALSGLPNRMLFRTRCESLLQGGSRLALSCLNMDDFRYVNETFGLAAGDQLLREVAERLRKVLGDADGVCRWSADEFLVMIASATDLDSVSELCARIAAAVSRPFEVGGTSLELTLSQGVAQFPEDASGFDELLGQAAAALQAAKGAGKNIVRYATAGANDRVREHFWIAQGLRRALQQREFEIHYQPQIELASGRLAGAEALLRWRDPERGLVAPGRFIGVAEQTGLIVDIGAWVVEQVCADAARWKAGGFGDIQLSLNVSLVQMRRGGFASILADAMARHGLDAGQLEVELTESVFMDDALQMRAVLADLKRSGLRISIDDFGTGYSSLAYLRRLEVDRLKVDQTFVRGITDDADAAAIVSAVIQMAHALSLSVVAEGVEDEATMLRLREMGCDQAQGFLFDAALPREDFERRLRVGR